MLWMTDEEKWEIGLHNGGTSPTVDIVRLALCKNRKHWLTQVPWDCSFQVIWWGCKGNDMSSNKWITFSTKLCWNIFSTYLSSENEYATLYIVHNSAQKHGIVMKDMNTGGEPHIQTVKTSI